MTSRKKELSTVLRETLWRLGIREQTQMYNQLSCALVLSVKHIELLDLTTKWLYPDVARMCQSNWRAVERNIRYALQRGWKRHADVICELAERPLPGRPTSKEFLEILTGYLQDHCVV